jgi:ribosome-interacting GTPase 1
MVENEDAVFARQRHGKHMSAATNTHTRIPELLEKMFSMLSMMRVYTEDE